MRIHELAGKTVCVLGYGKEGKATVKALEQFAPSAEITIADKNADVTKDSDTHWWQLGEGWLENLRKFDVIIKSPGISLSVFQDLSAISHKLTSSTQIFLDSIAGTGAIVVGVTGSKGKSTTSSLIAAILNEAGRDTHLVGNIGDPSIAHLAQAKKDTIFIHELSSYQLQTLTASPHVAVAVSFFPEHLDVHESIEAYLDAKKNICRFQTEDDRAYFNADAPGAVTIAAEGHGRKIPVTVDDAPVRLDDTNLLGEHNLANIALAWKVCEDLGVRKETVIAALKKFQPLPHRLQKIGIVGGIEWIDDAISTTPESAIAALDALGDDVRTIILGGQDRGLDFTGLAKRLKESKVQTVILFPGSGPRIREALTSPPDPTGPVTSPPDPLSAEAERGNVLFAKHAGKEHVLRSVRPSSQEFALELRKNMTEAEEILWEALRDRTIGDAKFRRQHPMGKYVADFYCAAANLVIELDGGIHATEEKQYADKERDSYFHEAGLKTVRFTNADVMSHLPTVLKTIKECLTPLHLNGEGQGVRCFDVSSMKDAVRLAREHTPQGMIVLLSTASPSYGMFKNFEEKGRIFQECVHSL